MEKRIKYRIYFDINDTTFYTEEHDLNYILEIYKFKKNSKNNKNIKIIKKTTTYKRMSPKTIKKMLENFQ